MEERVIQAKKYVSNRHSALHVHNSSFKSTDCLVLDARRREKVVCKQSLHSNKILLIQLGKVYAVIVKLSQFED